MGRAPLASAALAGLLTIGAASLAVAQPILDPNYLEFTASADHDATEGGVAVVTRYDLLLYIAGSSAATRTVNLGKPAPDASRTIRLSLRSALGPLPAAGTAYQVRVAAVGPGGSARSALSNPFSFAPVGTACTYTVTPLTHAVRAAGGTVSVTVTAPAGCPWTASEGSAWLSIASGGTGTGNGTVAFTVAAYTGTDPRAATATIAGRTVSFAQTGRPRPPAGFRIIPR